MGDLWSERPYRQDRPYTLGTERYLVRILTLEPAAPESDRQQYDQDLNLFILLQQRPVILLVLHECPVTIYLMDPIPLLTLTH
jgi:hypothetical protein